MTLDEIYSATPSEIDALLHEPYGDGSFQFPAYSSD
jgi:hypothetical protein